MGDGTEDPGSAPVGAPPPGTPPNFLLGRTLGEFVVREKLGEGGFGEVYRAEQPLLGREAVIKVLHGGLSNDASITQRFLREARLASKLDHPYAAHVYAFGAESDGLLWIAMELVRGTPLDRLLKEKGPLPLEKFVPLLDHICEVVQTAHETGIIHRDLKPANIMIISRAGRLLPKLLDFGVARLKVEPAAGSPALPELPHPAFLSPALAASLGQGSATLTVAKGAPASEKVSEETPPSRPSNLLEGTPPSPTPPQHYLLGRTLALSPELMTQSVVNTLTRQDATFLGSPHYTAPEQWMDSSMSDARTDIYALGVTSYQLLTGRTPFTGKTVLALAEEHLKKRPPPLGGQFPEALDLALARALAKRPLNRYATVLEFAAAVRAASGLAAGQESFPRLDEALVQELIVAAPRPLAEAAAGIDAAGTVKQAWEAAGNLATTALRFLGLLALSAHGQLRAPPQASDLKRLNELSTQLVAEGLNDSEWLELTRTLLAPFARRAELHPLPELVRFFWESPGAGLLPEADLFSQMHAVLRKGADSSAEAAEPALLPLVTELYEPLRKLLHALSFLSDYQLVVPTAALGEPGAAVIIAERWMGTRRARQPVVRLSAKAAAVALHPLLLDAEGAPTLSLWPLCQVAEPTPGAAQELFLVSSGGRYGARMTSLPGVFERQDEALAQWLLRELVPEQKLVGEHEAAERTPYRGLSAFTSDDASSFFGREREAEAFLNRLRVTPLLAVVGASGAGKSSFVQAGVVPLLPKSWLTVVVRPGATPVETLLEKLAAVSPQLGAGLRSDPDALGVALENAAQARGDGASILLVIDQFEETVTLCRTLDERNLYTQALARAARAEHPHVRVVLTLRDDFLMRVQQLPALQDRLAQGLQLLATPGRDDLMRIVSEPARRLGYSFEPPTLVETMADSVVDQPGALALLSFTAFKLWELRDRHFKHLSLKAYTSLGGVGGALAQHAEDCLMALSPEEQPLVREAFRHLVTADGTRAILTRRDLRQLLGNSRAGDTVLERLIQSRLLVASEGTEEGLERIEVTHEALLSAWPRLVKWRHEDVESVRLRDELRAAARAWDAKGRGTALLWRGELLTEYRLWRTRYQGQLTDAERAFAQESLKAAARALQLKRGLLALAFLAMAFATGIVLRLNALGHQRYLELIEEQGRQALLAGKPLHAAAYLSAALRDGGKGARLEFMLARALGAMGGELTVFDDPSAELETAFFSRNEQQVLVGSVDEKLKVYNAQSGKLLTTFKGFRSTSATALRDGRVVASDRFGGRLVLLEPATGKVLRNVAPHAAGLGPSLVTRDERTVITAGADGEVKLWDIDTGALRSAFKAHTGEIAFMVLSADGSVFLTGCRDGTAKLWETATGKLRATLKGHTQVVWRADISSDNLRVVTGSDDATVRVWDAETGKPVLLFDQHQGHITQVHFSPDGRLVLSASEDGTAKLFDVATGHTRAVFSGSGRVSQALFNSKGDTVAIAASDPVVRLYAVSDGHLLWSFARHTGTLASVAFSADGRQLLTSSADGTARLWDAHHVGPTRMLQAPEPILATRPLPNGRGTLGLGRTELYEWDAGGLLKPLRRKHTPSVPDAPGSFSLDSVGRNILLANGAVLELRDLSSFELKQRWVGHTDGITWLGASPDGTHLLSVSLDHTARLWSSKAPAPLFTWTTPREFWISDFSPDGRFVATSSQDGDVALWDTISGKQVRSFKGHGGGVNSARFSRDGTRLITASDDRTLRVWDVSTGAPLTLMLEQDAALTDALLGPDNALAYSAGLDGAVRAWDARTGKLLGTLGTHRGAVLNLQLSDDGRTLDSSGEDGVVNSWDVGFPAATGRAVEREATCAVPYFFDGHGLIPRMPTCPKGDSPRALGL